MPKIVIAEDDKFLVDLYQKKFSDSGFEVFVASNEKEVFDIIEQEKADVLLVSLIMGGLEIVKKIRQEGSNMKIIITGYYDVTEDGKKAIEAGADKFIDKSHFIPAELVEEIKKLMEK